MDKSSPTSRFGAPITPTIDALIAKLDAATVKSEYHRATHEIAGFLQGHRDYIAELEQKLAAASENSPRVEQLEQAIRWVLTDAAYKPPEEIGDIPQRWIACLQRAVK